MICQAIKDSSAEVFKWISKQKEVGEESITDWSLYNANKLDGRIQYRQFNRHEEGRITGADFELWILNSLPDSFSQVLGSCLKHSTNIP